MSHCDCSTICSRWVSYSDGSGGWFCPYALYSETICKKTIDIGKDMQPTIVTRYGEDNERVERKER